MSDQTPYKEYCDLLFTRSYPIIVGLGIMPLKILLQLCPNSSSTIKNVSSTVVAVYYLQEPVSTKLPYASNNSPATCHQVV